MTNVAVDIKLAVKDLAVKNVNKTFELGRTFKSLVIKIQIEHFELICSS